MYRLPFMIATLVLATTVLLGASLSQAETPSTNPPKHYTVALGLQGYSPVSYFEDGPEVGSPAFPVSYEGVTYFVTDAAQAKKFNNNPGRYVPAYGGWCAFGMAVEDHFVVDPSSYKIINGKLHLFLKNPDVDAKALWDKEGDAACKVKADRFWSKTQGG